MAEGDGQGIRGIQVPRFQPDAQRFFQHQLHLLLGGGSVSHNGLLGLSGGILRHGSHPVLQRGNHGRSLGPAQFEHHLRILSVERALDGQLRGMVAFANLGNAVIDGLKLHIRILFLPQIQHAHVHVGGLLSLRADNPEAQQLRTRVYAQYDASVFHKAHKVKKNRPKICDSEKNPYLCSPKI